MRGFIEELRYRNVLRVAVAYVVAGWLVAQVADLAADAFNAPDWFMQMLIILLLVGLPVVLFLAWAYELTPDGVKKAKDLPADMPKDPRSGRLLNRITIVALLIAVAWLGWDKLQQPGEDGDTEPDVAGVASIDKSIAVLPFDDFSPGGDQAWFADGLTEEILNSLARTPDLLVASRTSSFGYRDAPEDLSTIAEALGVAHILEGSVRRAGDQLRITAQLIRASDDKHLWSQSYDGNIDNSIAIQEEIAIEIARALQTAMDPEELARMVAAGTRSVDAWEVYLKGLAQLGESFQQVQPEMIYEAIDDFDRAIAIDPSFADAYEQLVNSWFGQLDITTTTYTDIGPPYAERREHFEAALGAWIRHARDEADRLRAKSFKARYELRLRDEIRLLERLVEVDPLSRADWAALGELYLIVNRPADARTALLEAWALPRPPGDSGGSIVYNMRRADIDEAVRLVEERLAENEVPPFFYYQAHRALLDAGLLERALEMHNAYVLRAPDGDAKTMLRIRQACAEGRVADAVALVDGADPGTNIRWLMLKTVGRDAQAREHLARYDTPETLFILAGFLEYRAFEPRDFPLLWRSLQSQGVSLRPTRPQTFRCRT